MAEPPTNKVFSIFQPRTKPAPAPSARDLPPLEATTSELQSRHASTTAATVSESSGSTSNALNGRAVDRTGSKESDCITLSDDEDDGALSPRQTRSKVIKGKQGVKTKAQKGKGKARAIADAHEKQEEEDEDDCIVVKGSTPKKRQKQSTKESNISKGKKKAKGPIKELESIDLTESPPRKPSAPFPSSTFAPLSDLYRHERERRKANNEGVEPRWPTAEEHGKHLSTMSASSRTELRSRTRYPGRPVSRENDKGKGKAVDSDEEFLTHLRNSLESNRLPSPESVEYRDLPFASTSTLVPSYPSHPLLHRLDSAISSSPTNRKSTTQSELWTNKYGPKKAEEVLGDVSGSSALLLKEWLTELKVAGGIEDENSKKRRRPVNRGIDKKKKKKRRRDDLDDFLASSSGEEDEAMPFNTSMFENDEDLDEDDLATFRQGGGGGGSIGSSSSTFHRLTNLILLVGPNGSGKTSSVQAVAQELGYEIFEVNAGMGKRRAKDLEAEVGDVGRNHIVRASPRKPNAKDFFAGFKAVAAKGKETKGSKSAGPTQSLILIEEVDVLYVGEEDFWAGMRALAEESRRPIILTCNDSTLIPFDQLGLQKIHLATASLEEPLEHLPFAPPSSSLITPYLQLVALSEGHLVSPEAIERLYEAEESTTNEGEEAWLTLCKNAKGVRPLPHPFTSEGKKEKDLRKALMQLQFELQRDGKSEKKTKEGEKRWIVGGLGSKESVEGTMLAEASDTSKWLARAVAASDALSFADAEVSRRIETRIENLDYDTHTTPSDLESGSIVLSPRPPPPHSTQLPYLGREPEMASLIENLAYSIYPQAVHFTTNEDESLEFKKVEYLHSLALLSTQFFWQPISATYLPYAPILPSPSLVIDYLPLYRHLTQVDDERERIAAETGEDVSSTAAGGRGAGVRRSTRVTGGSATVGGAGGKARVKITKEIEWRAPEDAEFVRSSGFDL
ncbi:uncharacterized protein JCM6883_005158 [Sporobolomyces salmoneus]|uniref:uncharacterized protein n=1 Tax=Sporobolomyces salmoneus TaxID=183962 RepID=UPI0031744425